MVADVVAVAAGAVGTFAELSGRVEDDSIEAGQQPATRDAMRAAPVASSGSLSTAATTAGAPTSVVTLPGARSTISSSTNSWANGKPAPVATAA